MTRKTAAEYRATMTEAELLWAIIEAANAIPNAWLAYHTHDSRRSNAGFPDLVLVGHPSGPFAGRMYVFELKTENRQATAEQTLWVRAIQLVQVVAVEEGSRGFEVGAAVVRPAHLEDVLSLIQTGRPNGRLAEDLVSVGNGDGRGRS